MTTVKAYAGHPISKFLSDHAVSKGQPISLTRIGNSSNASGKFYISDEEYPQFLDLLHDYLFVKRLTPITLVEQRNLEKAYPSLIDLDFRYAADKNLSRTFDDSHIRTFIEKYSEGLLKFYKNFPNGEEIRYFVSLRPQPYRKKSTSKGEPILNDGIHIMSPDLVAAVERQRVMRLWTFNEKIIETAFEGTEYINTVDHIFDESLVKKNGWFLYGESKPDIPAYILHKVYVLNTLTGAITEQATSEYTPRSLMELLSIRYGLREEITAEQEHPESVEEYKRLLSHCNDSKSSPAIRSTVAPTIPESLDLTAIVANYLAPPQSDRDMAITRRLVLECLSDKRADNYATWRETEWCLRNINDSEEMFNLWLEFSKKSSKFSNVTVDREYREWRHWCPGSRKLTKRSLHYWAREDAPEKYNEIIQSDLIEWVSQGRCKNTHNHIAQLMSLLYDADYRVAMDSKRVTWYHYTGIIWETLVQGVELRMKLSTEIADIIAEGRKQRREWLIKQGTDDPGGDLIFKELLGIEKNLYQGPFKNSVMQEAANTFYERDFEKKLNTGTTLIGCANCILDLRAIHSTSDGKTEEYVQVRDPKPEDYISFLAGNNPPEMEPIPYIPYPGDEDPQIQELMEFFKKLFPNDELREYVLTLSASCLEGANREQAYYILNGGGGNGKTKWVELMRYTLGDYLTSLSTTAITRKRPDSGAANPDIIKVRNKRAIIMQEPDPNEPLNTSRMKQFSGEDDVEARGLFQDQETFKITGKLFMSCNKLPPIHTMDHGTWRRIRVIPFEARFVDPGDPAYDPSKYIYYKDYSLDAKLKTWRVKFFSLLVHYYETRYLKGGLNPPKIVMQVSNGYKYNHDSFTKFFETCVRRDPEATDITLTKMFRVYTAWYSNLAGSSGAKLKSDDFKTRLEEKLNITITKNVRGICVFASEEEADTFDKEGKEGEGFTGTDPVI